MLSGGADGLLMLWDLEGKKAVGEKIWDAVRMIYVPFFLMSVHLASFDTQGHILSP